MVETSQDNTGRCLCGAIQYTVSGKPLWVAHCHCASCRRHTGSAVATFVGYRRERFTHVGDDPGAFNSSPGVTRSFCRRCGTPITYESDRWEGEVHILIGTFDNPSVFTPTLHVYTAEQLPWLHLADDLPRYRQTPKGGAKPMS